MSEDVSLDRSSSEPANPPKPDDKQQQVPLAPACLMIFIILLLFLSVALVAGAWMLMGNQSKNAAKALEQQLIPWVEQSTLDPTDKSAILETLKEVVADVQAEKYSDRQLTRLNVRVTENPIFQWGVIQQLENRIALSTLTETEKRHSHIQLDRFLRAASEGKLSMQQMEFAVQPVATKERLTGKLMATEKTSDADLQEFLRRVKAIGNSYQIPEEEFSKSVSQVFRNQIADAKSVD